MSIKNGIAEQVKAEIKSQEGAMSESKVGITSKDVKEEAEFRASSPLRQADFIMGAEWLMSRLKALGWEPVLSPTEAEKKMLWLCGVIVSCRRDNTDEWMIYLAQEINKCLEFLRESDRVEYSDVHESLQRVKMSISPPSPPKE